MTSATTEPTAAGRRSKTITEIAELAGVSVPTVSKVVNGRVDVAPETRALVESLIRQHGFHRPKKRAASADIIELVFHELEGAYAMEVIKGVEQVAWDNQLSVVLSELRGRHTPGKGWVEGVLRRRPAGVISVFSGLDSGQREQLHSRGIPFVLVDPTGEPDHQFPSVGATNWNGGLAATRHLLELGHRRIAIVTGPAGVLSSRARFDGYRAAMDAAGVPVDPALVYEGDFHLQDGLAAGRKLLKLKDRPTAFFACNDLQAIGVYQAAHEAGLRVPTEVSVVGFDDLPPAQWAIPAMTTIRQPLRRMAAAAASMVITLRKGDPLPQHRLELVTELVVRESTAPPIKP
ncbi:LacI family DNA-binding transcriptional regulator [Allorhizocola rhizosphaerae]|uniref:LacI family DNA-binding transcriptional regulator n=1 Tax=Allorhizocola rhizosphaerae TaxID=1872709 RepID=UPI000E3D0C15|nr:LacI family DNA-binding transcriptional regulator [Allorhizocola rhizosphaerae]